MSKFYEEETEGAISNRSNDKSDDEGKIETLLEDDEAGKILQKLIKQEEDKKEILKLTMLINKYTSDFEMKRNWSNGSSSGSRNNLERYKKDVKCTMFFNKEVTIRPNIELSPPPLTVRSLEPTRSPENYLRELVPAKSNRFRTNQKFDPTKPIELQFCKFHISDLEVSSSLRSFQNELFDKKSKFSKAREQENLKKFLARKNVKTEKGSVQTDLRTHNSLTALSKNIKLGLKGVLKSKIPSMTAIETNSTIQKSGSTKYSYWEDLTRLPTFPTDPEKHLGLQISKSSNDNNRRSVTKFKKEEAGSVSDSKLLNTDLETKKRIKKCDKKSRGDSSKKEKEIVGKKQVQWKTEVDVIYFSTHLAANGDRTGEVIGRVMEPLREEWEQQRKGFYAKIVPYHFESHIKDHFISLLKI